MKSIILILSLFVSGISTQTGIEKDLEQISKGVHSFARNADNQNVKGMEKVLHKDFRAVVNRLFGSEEVSIMDKTVYLNLLKNGKIGGTKRTVLIHSIDMESNNAIVRATFSGKALIFTTFIQLVKDTSGQWTVISDFPSIQKIE